MPTFIERRSVSRKTPRDGKLEITKRAAGILAPVGDALRVSSGGRAAPARVESMTCTCRGGDAPHEHYFVQSDVLRTLEIGADVDLSLEPRKALLSITAAS